MEQELQIAGIMAKRSGLIFDPDKFTNAAAFVRQRVHSAAAGSNEGYLKLLNSPAEADEIDRFITLFSVSETYFFRNANHWQAFKEHVLPSVLKRKQQTNRSLRIWSAGCSTGEEPYTLAIYILENRTRFHNWDFRILATDINSESLAKAANGLYSSRALRGMEPGMIDRYFEKIKSQYRIKEHVRQKVVFQKQNLASAGPYPRNPTGAMDIIFCRNVLMYFQPETATHAIRKLCGCLHDEGFFFLGHAEGNLAPRDILEPKMCCGTFIFQKKALSPSKQKLVAGANRTVPEKKSGDPAKKITGHCKEPEQADGRANMDTGIYRKALVHYYRNNFEKALATLKEHAGDDRGDLRKVVLTGLIHYKLADLNQAEQYRLQAYRLSSLAAEVHVLKALIDEARGDFNAAIRANQKAIFLDKHFLAPHLALCRIYKNSGDPVTSRRHCNNALNVLERDDMARVNLFCGPATRKLLAELAVE